MLELVTRVTLATVRLMADMFSTGISTVDGGGSGRESVSFFLDIAEFRFALKSECYI